MKHERMQYQQRPDTGCSKDKGKQNILRYL